jgi:bacterial/archaeal transporter family-2 protein
MDRGLAVILTVVVGALIALQPPVNAGLGRVTGNVAAAFVSFLVGTLLLALLVGISGQTEGLRSTFDIAPHYLTGGILGVAYVFTVLVTVSSIGAGGVAAATITGQLTASIVIDRLGILGLEQQALSVDRMAGVALLLAGTYLVVR